jgi:hypothetical protein
MKRLFVMVFVMVLTLGFTGLSWGAEPVKQELKAGDEIYVCNCGEKCECGSMSRKGAKCSCGKEMVKVAVTRVEGGMAFYKLDEKERSVKTAGKYACACGPGCKCGMISQKPGKCGCGVEMKKVE